MRYFGVDIGNSGIRIAELHVADHALSACTRVSWRYNDACSSDRHGRSRYLPSDPAWLTEFGKYFDVADATWLVSSVRRDALNVLQTRLNEIPKHSIPKPEVPKHSVHIVGYRDVAITVNVEAPEKVGIDRLLAALAASSLSAIRPLIVIQAGSAVTVDLLTQSAERPVFEGGTILPGVPMMLRLLGKAADQLPEMDADDLTDLPPIPGKDTEQAMLGGAASALIGGVNHIVERYRSSLGRPVPVILSGGDGTRIAPYIPEPLVVEPDLVQRGLLILASTFNASDSSTD